MHNLPAKKLTIKNDQVYSGQVDAIVGLFSFIVDQDIPDEIYKRIDEVMNSKDVEILYL